jgi:hypothetical protein
MRALRFLLPWTVLLYSPKAANAQTTQGILWGVVGDSSSTQRKSLPDILVKCTNAATGETFDAPPTNSSGTYYIANLSPGEYILDVRDKASYYQAREIHGIEVGVAGKTRVDPDLTPLSKTLSDPEYRTFKGKRLTATAREYGLDIDRDRLIMVETVDSRDSLLDATRSDLIRPGELEALPLSGRDVFAMFLTEPGVTADSGTIRSLGMEAGGQRPSSSSFLLDGIEFNNYLVTGPLAFVPPESVQEYRVSTNNFSSEYGGATGFLANVVTRYGGEQWSGAIYSNLDNRALDAQRTPHGPERDWRIGYQTGGPLLAKRLFVSSAFDFLRDRTLQAPVIENFPSAAFLTFLAKNYSSNSSMKLLKDFPPPVTAPSTDGDVSPLQVTPPISLNQWLSLNRVDYSFRGGLDRVTARVAVSDLSRPDFIWSPYKDFVSGLKQPVGSVMIGLQDARRRHLTNELRMGWTASNIHWDRAHPEIATLTVIGGNPRFERPLLPGSPAPYGFRYRSTGWELHDHFINVTAKNVFSAGGGFLSRHIDNTLTLLSAGWFAFGSIRDFAIDSPGNFLGSAARLALPNYGPPSFEHSYKNLQWFGFVNDTHRFSPRWSGNLGIRYESLGAPVDLSSGDDVVQFGPGGSHPQGLAATHFVPIAPGTALYRPGRADWAVRAGLSFDAFGSGKTVVRAGYGIFYDRAFDNIWETVGTNNLILSPPIAFASGGACTHYLEQACRVSLLSGGITPSDSPTPLAFDPKMRDPYAQNAFLAVQQKLGSAWSAEINTLGSLGTHLVVTDLLNRSFSVQSDLTNNSTNGDPTRYSPHLPEIYYRGSGGSSHYFGMTALLRRRSRALYFQAAFTWSHSKDSQSDPLLGEFFDLSFTANGVSNHGQIAAFTRQYDSKSDRGNSDFDQRHNFIELLVWQLPSASWKPVKLLSEGWRLSEIGAFRSGFPFSVFVPGSGDLINNRADLVPGVDATQNLSSPNHGGKYILNANAFQPPAAGTIGTTARNQFYGPGLYNFDLSLSRRIGLSRLGEHFGLTLRVDAYNLLNHLNLGPPDHILGPGTFGLSVYGRTLANSGFPVIAPLQETSRRLQVLLRFEF